MSTTSFNSSPQATGDIFNYLEDGLSAVASSILLDVMANDLGGRAKTLFSIDDGLAGTFLSATDLLNVDGLVNGISAWEVTSQGNLMRINNGKIELDLSHSYASLGISNVNSLSATESISDTLIYAIRLGNGTLSWAHVSVTIQGENDIPEFLSGTVSGSVGGNSERVLFFDDFSRPASDDVGGSWVEVAETNSPYTNSAGQYVDATFAHVANEEMQLTAQLNPGRLSNFYNKGGGQLSLAAPLSQPVGSREVTISFDYKTGPDESSGPRVGLMNAQSGFENYPLEGVGIVLTRSDSHYDNSAVWIEKFTNQPAGGSPVVPHLLPFQFDNGKIFHVTIDYSPEENMTVSISDGSQSFSFSEYVGPLDFDLDQLYLLGGTDISFGTPGLLENTSSIDNVSVVVPGDNIALTADGSVNFSDVDLSDGHTVSVSPDEQGYVGVFDFELHDSVGTGSGSVDWHFNVSSGDISFLAPGETRDQTYEIQIDDGHGGIVTQKVTITISGLDDAII